MNIVELIRKKRNGGELNAGEIKFIINGYVKGNIPDYQISPFLMAVYFNGMTKDETSALTEMMLHSGTVVDLSGIKGRKIDKHSTGGVGDKTSLILAPVAAAAGVNVPMISGRGLGHTGGTLDKLESIPGFKTDLSLAKYKSVLRKTGAVLIGQTKNIAPADKLLYALRDVTAAVESIPLITASIMSKKLAEGIDGLVLDVKTGSGAFMQKQEDSVKLAESLINTAKAFGKDVIAFLTDMDKPLGNYVGNWLEVYESLMVLNGENIPDLTELSLTLSGAMIYLGAKAESVEEGIAVSEELIKSGKAMDKFIEITKAQGGDVSLLKEPGKYAKPKYVEKYTAQNAGCIYKKDTYSIGIAALELGAGRMSLVDKIDPKAGIIFHKSVGDKVEKGDVIAELHTDNKKAIAGVKERLNNAVVIDNKKQRKQKLIKRVLS